MDRVVMRRSLAASLTVRKIGDGCESFDLDVVLSLIIIASSPFQVLLIESVILVTQREPLFHISSNIVAYCADHRRKRTQSGGLEGCVAHLHGGFDCALIVDPVCRQVETLPLIDPPSGTSRAAIGSGDCPVRAGDLRSRQPPGPPLVGADNFPAINFLVLSKIPRRPLLIDDSRIERFGERA